MEGKACLFLKSKKLKSQTQKPNLHGRVRAWKKQLNALKTTSSEGYQLMDRLSFPLNQKVSAKIIMSANTFSARVIFHHLQYWHLRSLQKTLGFCMYHGISFAFSPFPICLPFFPVSSVPLPLFFLSFSPPPSSNFPN